MTYGYLGNLYEQHPPRKGMTLSNKILEAGALKAIYFALGEGTSISRESYPNPGFYFGMGGEILIEGEKQIPLAPGALYLRKENELVGQSSVKGGAYLEIALGNEGHFNLPDNHENPLVLKDLVPWEKDGIANWDLWNGKEGKFVVMSLDQGEALSAHRAPGEALILALEGEADFTYEGTTSHLVAGDAFRMAKNGLHALDASKPFKMALLLHF